MKKCITKKALSVLLAVMLTVSVFATCLVFSTTAAAADDPDAIKIDNIGYHHVGGLVQVIAGNNKTVEELTGKDMNYNKLIVVDKNNVVVKTYELLGTEKGKKNTVVCPEGGYIIGIHGDHASATVVENQNTDANTVHPGDTIQLNNVNLEEVRKLSGKDNYVNVTDASFKVIPYNTNGVTLSIVSVNQKVQGETNGIITKYSNPATDAGTYATTWTKLIRLKNIEGNKYEVVNDFWAFGNKVEALTEGELFLTVACSGPSADAVIGEKVTNLVGNYVAYGVKKGDTVEINGDITKDGAVENVTATFTRLENLALKATVVGKTPSYEDLTGKWPSSYTGKVNDGISGKRSETGMKGVTWAAFYNAGSENAKNNYDGKVGEIVIDFGAKQDFSSFRTHIWGTAGSGIAEMSKVEFFVSDDNKEWTSAGAVTEGLAGTDDAGVWVELKAAASGRYVKYAYTKSTAEGKGGVFMFVSECEAYGKATPVVIDVDTTGWTKVDGETVGQWQTALTPVKPTDAPGEVVGSYVYKAGKVDGKYVIEVVFSGELSGAPGKDQFGNGYGTNVRVWFHSAKNEAGTEQLSYNTLLDVAYNGTEMVSRLATNSSLDANKANWILGYDAEKPYTVESIIPTAKDGLYVKITFDKIPNIVDNNDVAAVISVSNKPAGKSNNCLHSNTYVHTADVNDGPWSKATWTTENLGTTISFAEPVDEPSSEPSSEEPSSEPSSEEPSTEPSSEASTASTASTASAGESSVDAPQTGDMGIAAIALLAIVTAGGVFAVRKFR